MTFLSYLDKEPVSPALGASTLPLGYRGGGQNISPDLIYYSFFDRVLDRGLNPGPPTLEASTLPLSYRVVGNMYI